MSLAEENKPSTPCATPTISYESGKLKFTSETAGAEYHYTINDEDVAYDAYSKNGEVSLTAAYKISAYATADGYKASDKAEATLYWVSANLRQPISILLKLVVSLLHHKVVSSAFRT